MMACIEDDSSRKKWSPLSGRNGRREILRQSRQGAREAIPVEVESMKIPESIQHLITTALFGAVVASAAMGCGEDLPQDPAPPVRVQVVFDPDTSTIPLPNQAAVQSDGTLPKSQAERGTAQAAFYDWIDDLHGWLPETPIEVPFNGKLAQATIDVEDVILLQIAEDGSTTELEVGTVTYLELEAQESTPARSKIVITPATPLAPASRYGVIVKTSIDGENGAPILAPAGIFFGLNDGPLVDENDRITIPQLESSPDTARSLESLVRKSLTPLVDYAKQEKIDRKNIAAAFTWSTGTDTFTVLDPATATIPLPNTLAMDEGEDGLPTFPAAALEALTNYRAASAAGESPKKNAQIYFEEYLDQLHGWPNSVASLPIEVPLTGPVDPDTITEESVQLWYVDAEGTPQKVEDVSREYVEEEGVHKIKLLPASDFALNTDYFAFATKALRDPSGNKILPPAAMALAIQPASLLEEGSSTVAQLDLASAQAAAGVQATLRPFVELIEDHAGYEYDELASVWSWYTWRDPFVVFDPASGDVPFPNAFLIGEDGTVNLPLTGQEDPLQKSLIEELNTRDGFSQLAQGWVTVQGELDPASVTLFTSDDREGSVAMASLPGALPELVDPELVDFEFVSDYGKIMMRPQLPLAQNTRHVVILTDRLRGTNDLPAKPSPIFVMLSSEYPLYDEEEGSLVAQLPDASAPALEEARKQYVQLFVGAAIATGDTRESIVGAFVFNTDDTTTPMQQARARVIEKLSERSSLTIDRACNVDNARDCSEDLWQNFDGSGDDYDGPYAGDLVRDFSNLQQVQWAAEFSTVNMLVDNGNTFANWEDITEQMRVGLSVFVPREVPGTCEPPFRVVIAQHGLTSTRLVSGMGFANTFAAPETCLAVVAPDAYLHGGRTRDLGDLHPTSYPSESGKGYLSANFVQSKHHFMQGALDLVVLNQLIRAGALETLVENTTITGLDPMFDTSSVAVTGTSLGGILVTAFTSIDPDINVANLAVAPGKLTYYLTEDSQIGDDLLAPLALFGIERGTFVFEQLVALLQWVGDQIDPAVFASHLVDETLAVLSYDPASDAYTEVGEVDPAQVFLQMARGDEVAPNVSTEQLAAIVGYPIEQSTFDAPHAFLGRVDPALPEYQAAECARRQMAFLMRAALDGDSTTLPSALTSEGCTGP